MSKISSGGSTPPLREMTESRQPIANLGDYFLKGNDKRRLARRVEARSVIENPD
jgi:hypothetical protein